MRSPSEEELKLLRLVAANRGKLDQEDPRLDPFVDDKSTLTYPDTLNRCIDLGWLHSSHDNSTDTGWVALTDDGRTALKGD